SVFHVVNTFEEGSC
ncbi:hypothetical protein AVEN_215336-1, partial [Araneus ventricosus]